MKPMDHPEFINREQSLLAFQQRVLDEAHDPRHPLLERVRFLSIVGSNMDEFFMVRVGGLIMQQQAGVTELSIDDLTPAEQLAAIRKRASTFMDEAATCWQDEVRPALAESGIHVLDMAELNDKQRGQVERYFRQVIFPVLTPLAMDSANPFPHISNLSLNLAVIVRDTDGEVHYARVKIPATLPRLVPIKRSSGGVRRDGTVPYSHYFVWLEQVVAAFLSELFYGMEVMASHPFRVTRNADFEIQELEADDLLASLSARIQGRQFGSVVRLAVMDDMPRNILGLLTNKMKVDSNDVYRVKHPLGMSQLDQLREVGRLDHKFPHFTPVIPPLLRPELREGSIFQIVRRGDVMLHHPYESFDPVLEFLSEAVHDPEVLAIKATLYRVGPDSPVVELLLKARRDFRKQVAVLVELKARFDEESNIGWARRLEREGVHVTYGLPGLKTHCKVMMVVRQEGDSIRRYMHLGTGNYNTKTARLYVDLGLLTCDEDIGADVTDLFNYLTGYARRESYRKLIVAPVNLRERLTALIRREIEHQQAGRPARLVFKMNSLVDRSMIRLLYEASQAGLSIDLIVRGICSLRPGVPGLSENIRVRSLVGRFLEHSRIYHFLNGGDEEVLLGSADFMTRNLNRRVEVLFPVENKDLVRVLRDGVLATYLLDTRQVRHMLSDGVYERREPEQGEAFSAQDAFLARAVEEGRS